MYGTKKKDKTTKPIAKKKEKTTKNISNNKQKQQQNSGKETSFDVSKRRPNVSLEKNDEPKRSGAGQRGRCFSIMARFRGCP